MRGLLANRTWRRNRKPDDHVPCGHCHPVLGRWPVRGFHEPREGFSPLLPKTRAQPALRTRSWQLVPPSIHLLTSRDANILISLKAWCSPSPKVPGCATPRFESMHDEGRQVVYSYSLWIRPNSVLPFRELNNASIRSRQHLTLRRFLLAACRAPAARQTMRVPFRSSAAGAFSHPSIATARSTS
ncbi:hypothetical protein LZ30DRAFT_91283 [Colletotrichum cereale]|nr:hypothetical protein LZ30DRAFT_91283 [Colletotrichum cereale]